MTWMDSYYRVHTLLLSMMDRDQDMWDMVGDATYILHTGRGVGPILWAVSAWLAMGDYINQNSIHPNINRSICVGACKALRVAIQEAMDKRIAGLDDSTQEDNYDNKIYASID